MSASVSIGETVGSPVSLNLMGATSLEPVSLFRIALTLGLHALTVSIYRNMAAVLQ